MTEKKTVQANFNFDITKLANEAAQQEIASLKIEIKNLTNDHSEYVNRLHKELRETKKERDKAEAYQNNHEYTKVAAINAQKSLDSICAQVKEIYKNIRSKRMGTLVDYVDDLCNKDVFMNMEVELDDLMSMLHYVKNRVKKTPTKKEKK